MRPPTEVGALPARRRRSPALATALAFVLAVAPVARADDRVTGAAPVPSDGTPKDTRPKIEDPEGVPVTFTSKDVAMHVYIAHGDVPGGQIPDPFEKLPKLPVVVRLAPGTYTVEAESPNASTGHERVVVEQGAPMTVEAHPGDASVKAFGGVFIAGGVVAALLGIIVIVSISPHDQSFNRWGVGLPLTLGGVGLAGLGVGMTVAGSTDIVAPHLPPGGAPRGVALRWDF